MSSSGIVLLSLLLSTSLQVVSTLNVVILHPFYSGSHVLTLHTVAEHLISRGHNVTTVRFVDPDLRLKHLGPKHTDIVLHLNNSDGSVPFTSRGEKGVFTLPMDTIWTSGTSYLTLFRLPHNPWRLIEAQAEALLSDGMLTERLVRSHFDVAIVDLIYNEVSLSLVNEKLKIPTVGFWAFPLTGGEAEFTTAFNMPSYVPTFLSCQTDRMDIGQRVRNFGLRIAAYAMMAFHCWYTDGLVRARLGTNAKSTAQLLSHLDAMLINTNDWIDFPRPLPPTFLNIGGLNVPSNSSHLAPLPQDVAKFMAEAPDGVILFSMGIVFDSAFVPLKQMLAIFDAFARLPQRVIVKMKSQLPFAVSQNILVKSFVPQQTILNHPKTVLFFSHCGIHGVLEAVWYGIPIVGMPIWIDQGDILARVIDRGIGVGVNKDATSQAMYEAIVEVRDNPKYTIAVRNLSKSIRLRRHHPLEDIEYILNFMASTGGAKHLRLASADMSLVTYLSLDVILYLILVACASTSALLNLIRHHRKRAVMSALLLSIFIAPWFA